MNFSRRRRSLSCLLGTPQKHCVQTLPLMSIIFFLDLQIFNYFLAHSAVDNLTLVRDIQPP